MAIKLAAENILEDSIKVDSSASRSEECR